MKMTRRQFLAAAGLTAVTTAVGIPVYSFNIEPHWVQFANLNMPISNMPSRLRGRTLVQLSDLHIGTSVSNDYLRTVFDQVKALNPDYIVYTGDFVSYDDASQVVAMSDVMQHAPLGRYGTAAVLGNHDYGHGWQQAEVGNAISKRLKELNIDVLHNERRTYDGLDIVGIEEIWFGGFRLDSAREAIQATGRPTVALCHNPDGADYDMWQGYNDWILSGHTHGGQCKPPFLPAPLLPVNNRTYTSGLFKLNEHGRSLYINRGVGHAKLKVRFNARPEVTVFTLDERAS